VSDYEMSAHEREAWSRRVLPLFAREPNCTTLARQAGFSASEIKTTAGYIGQFRDGTARALTYFLDEPPRLDRLATGLGTTPDRLRAIWKEVRAEASATADTLFLPGFEDWGPVSLNDGFVPPPLRGATSDLQAQVLSSLDKGLAVIGPRGSGVTTLLRRFASWAAGDGWNVTWGSAGGLPSGRATLVVLDGPEVANPGELAAWLKQPGHGVLQGFDGWAPVRPVAPVATKVHLLAVDAAWVDQLRSTALALSPRSEARRLKAVRRDEVHHLLDKVPQPTPEVAGALLRALVDGQGRDMVAQGAELAASAARRRLKGQHLQELLPAIGSVERWVSRAYLASETTDSDLHEVVRDGVVERAREVLNGLELVRASWEALDAALPSANGGAGLDVLREVDLVRQEGDHLYFRLQGLLAPGVADEVATDARALRWLLVNRRAEVLEAVVRTAAGPDALASALAAMDAPMLATATADLDARWLVNVRWTPGLVARMLGLLLATGAFDRAGYALDPRGNHWNPGRERRRATPPLPEAWLFFGAVAQLPSPAEVCKQAERCARELGVPVPEVTEVVVSLLIALACPTASLASKTIVWDALDDELFPSEGWIDHVSRTSDGLEFLIDPGRSSVALRILRRKEERPDQIEAQPVAAWVRLFERLCDTAPNRAMGVLTRMVQDIGRAVAATRDLVPDEGVSMDLRISAALLDTQLQMTALARALEHPPVRRRRFEVAKALHAWWGLVEDPAISSRAWEPHLVLEWPTPLSRIITSCYDPTERAALLRTKDGRLSPIWRAVLRSGVSFDDAFRLYLEVRDGGLGVGTGHQELVEQLVDGLVELASPNELERIPGFPTVASGNLPDATLLERYNEGLLQDHLRPYLWGFVASLDPSSIVWKLLSAEWFGSGHAELRRSVDFRVRRAEQEVGAVTAAVRLAPGVPLEPEYWKRLANAALLARVDAVELQSLLGSTGLDLVDATVLADVMAVLVAHDREWVRSWLLDRLEETPALVDRSELVALWAAAKPDPRSLADRLDAAPSRPSKGSGVIPALVELGFDGFRRWLANDDTRDAALGALARTADGWDRLREVLAEAAHVPSRPVLAYLVAQADGAGFDVLDAAAAEWPTDLRRKLWEEAATVARDPIRRREVWARLARCRL
jgi:hypothetical protein